MTNGVSQFLLDTMPGTIAAGTSLSNAIDCRNGQIIRFIMPQAWDPARLTFQVSNDNLTFHDLFDTEGHEVSVFVIPNTSVLLKDPRNINWVKLRSGTRTAPVVQSASRTITIVVLK
jgi:hypothetical protein